MRSLNGVDTPRNYSTKRIKLGFDTGPDIKTLTTLKLPRPDRLAKVEKVLLKIGVRKFSTSRTLNFSNTSINLTPQVSKEILDQRPYSDKLEVENNKKAFDELPGSDSYEANSVKDAENNKNAFDELPDSDYYDDNNKEDNKDAFEELPGSDCYEDTKESNHNEEYQPNSDSDTETVKGNNTDSDPTNTYETGSESSGYNHSESSTEQDPFALERYLYLPQNHPSSSNSSNLNKPSSLPTNESSKVLSVTILSVSE
jgi:hypothetical protein